MFKGVLMKLSTLLACLMLVLITATGVSADSGKVRVSAVSASQTVTVSLSEASWYGKDMSVTCYAPACTDTTNIANNMQYIVYLDQVKAGETFSFVINSKAVAGSYKLVLGCNGSKIETAFSFDAAADVTLTAPTGLKASQTAAKSVKISWAAVNGAGSYDIYRSTSAKKGFAKIGTSVKISYTDKKVKAGKTYYYKVVAKSASGSYTGKFSSVVKVSVLKAPKATVKAAKKQLKVSWKKITGAKGYKVYVSAKKKSGYKVKATVKGKAKTSATVKKLKSGKTYYVKVAAYIGTGKKVVVGAQSAAVKAKVK